MKKRFNFQINALAARKPWNEITPHVRHLVDRLEAVQFARKLAGLFDAEIRLTEGSDPAKLSGSYIREEKD